MKYIFLDIDGVLNAVGDVFLIDNMLEKEKLQRLMKLTLETKAHVVIISSRRCYKDERDLILKLMDDIYPHISFIADRILYKKRSQEIKEYLTIHPCDAFVILDDNDYGYSLDTALKPHFIAIDNNVGFTMDDYIKAKGILR